MIGQLEAFMLGEARLGDLLQGEKGSPPGFAKPSSEEGGLEGPGKGRPW